MKPAAFAYHSAGSVAEAVALLAGNGDEARLLAGGQSLVPMMNLRLARPAALVDINRVPGLDSIEADDGTLTVGALTRHARLLEAPAIARHCPVLAEAARQIAHPTIRARGTAGGSVAHADPTAELTAMLTLFDGAVDVASGEGTRAVPVGDLLRGPFTTTLGAGEMITALRFSLPPAPWGGAFLELAERDGDFAIAAAGAWVVREDERMTDVGIVCAGAEGVPVRARAIEAALTGDVYDAGRVREAVGDAVAGLDAADDLRASAAYRREALGVLCARAVARAYERAGAAS